MVMNKVEKAAPTIPNLLIRIKLSTTLIKREKTTLFKIIFSRLLIINNLLFNDVIIAKKAEINSICKLKLPPE